MTLILGLETSCDETAASVVAEGRAVWSNVIASQHDLHARYGGVVPEIASRAHLERLTAVLQEAVVAAGVSLADIDAVAVGNRPGLIGSLVIGVSAAKAAAWALGKPLIGVDHVKAHLYAAALSLPDQPPAEPPAYPALGLVVSGGHTSLYDMASPTQMTLIGRTIDDAVGEAYDKAAVILQAGYPGGPRLDKLAQQGQASRVDPLPQSMLSPHSLDFSFSGLKTALLYRVRGKPTGRGDQATFTRSLADLSDQQRRDLAAAFQHAAIGAVMTKIHRAVSQLTDQGRRPGSLVVGGGVSANSLLRQRMLAYGRQQRIPVYLPPMSLCLDNAAMIAGLAWHHLQQNQVDDLHLPTVATTSAA